MSLRIASLRRISPISRSLPSVRFYAAPKSSRSPRTPKGLGSILSSSSTQPAGTTVAPKPSGSEPPSGPSTPKTPDVDLPSPTRPPSQQNEPAAEEEGDVEVKQKKLSESMGGNAGKKAGFGGGGGGGGGGSGGPGGGPGGDPGFKLNMNTLFLGGVT